MTSEQEKIDLRKMRIIDRLRGILPPEEYRVYDEDIKLEEVPVEEEQKLLSGI